MSVGGWPISSITSATSSGLSSTFTCEHPYALHPRFSCQHSSCTTSPHAEQVCAASVDSIFHWQMLQTWSVCGLGGVSWIVRPHFWHCPRPPINSLGTQSLAPHSQSMSIPACVSVSGDCPG